MTKKKKSKKPPIFSKSYIVSTSFFKATLTTYVAALSLASQTKKSLHLLINSKILKLLESFSISRFVIGTLTKFGKFLNWDLINVIDFLRRKQI